MAAEATATRAHADPRSPIWSRSFVAVCIGIFLAYAHYGLLTPAIPLYLHGRGLSEVTIGLALAAFSVMAVIVRPFIGYWADHWSAPGMARLGMITLGVTSVILLAPFTAAAVVANALRGLGWAGTNTGSNTLVAHIAPANRRGEASGYYSTFQSAANALFPFCALWLLQTSGSGFAIVFALAGGFSFLGATVYKFVTYRPVRDLSGAASSTMPWRSLDALVDRQVLPATLLQTISAMGQPAAGAFVPLFAQRLGIDLRDVGWYFVATGVAAVIGRGPLGRLSDRFGRGPSIAAGFAATTASFLLLSVTSSVPMLIVAGVTYSLGYASTAAAVLALAFDRANPARRGTAMATYSLGSQLGIALGSTLWGGVIELAGYRGMYVAAAVCAAMGIVAMIAIGRAARASSRWPG